MAENPLPGSLEFHTFCLYNLCRICSCRAQKYQEKDKRPPKKCVTYKESILELYGIDVTMDEKDVHPPHLCELCYRKLLYAKRPGNEQKYAGEKQSAAEKNKFWIKHRRNTDSESCRVCTLFEKQSVGGAPVKQKKGRPKKYPTDLAFSRYSQNIFASLVQEESSFKAHTIDIVDLWPAQKANFICPLCQEIFEPAAVKSQCEHYFCSSCLSDLFKQKLANSVKCPMCDETIDFQQVSAVEKRFREQLFTLPVRCKICKQTGVYRDIMLHTCEDISSSESNEMVASTSETPVHDSNLATPITDDSQAPQTTNNNANETETGNIIETISPIMSPNTSGVPIIRSNTQISPPTHPAEVAHSTPETQRNATQNRTAEVQTTPSIDTTLNSSLQQAKEAPLSHIEEKVYTSLTRRKLHYAGTSTVYCKTGGQPILMQKVRKARKRTTDAPSPLKKKRARELAKVRSIVSGQCTQSVHEQQTAELKALRKKTRISVCGKAGIQHRTFISKRVSLAMKSHLRLTWNQLRKQKCFLRKAGVQFESEKMERKEQIEILRDNLKGKLVSLQVKSEKAPDSVGTFVKRDCPLIQVKSISAFLEQRLDEYDAANKLIYSSNNIPTDEIWVKFGGDHGGDSFKVAMQILNLEAPNARGHTNVILCFKGKDYHSNLKKTLGPLKLQIEDVQKMVWKGKKVRVFMCGDYDFLCKMYGLSGSRGIHCCLWCLTASSEIQKDRQIQKKTKARKLNNIKVHHRNFVSKGKGKKANASKFFNVIHLPIWDIPIRQVCPPYLHILLGVVKRHHDHLEEACHKIDIAIAWDIARSTKPLGDNTFDKFVCKLREIVTLKDQLNTVISELETCEETTPLAQLAGRETTLRCKIGTLKEKIAEKKKCASLDLLSGPVTANLENILQQHKIQVQAYHSRSFVGNHCVKYLHNSVREALACGIVNKANELSQASRVQNMAVATAYKFNKLNELYSNAHEAVSHMLPIPPDHISDIQLQVDRYLNFYRQCFPGKVTPKQHMLEHHVPQWMARWEVGMALHGEQGEESIHAEFNLLKRVAFGVRQQVDQLMVVMKDHHVRCSPTIQQHVVHPQKRK